MNSSKNVVPNINISVLKKEEKRQKKDITQRCERTPLKTKKLIGDILGRSGCNQKVNKTLEGHSRVCSNSLSKDNSLEMKIRKKFLFKDKGSSENLLSATKSNINFFSPHKKSNKSKFKKSSQASRNPHVISLCSKDKVLISTLPRAKIDISGSDTITRVINFTYNSDEIVNFYLKLKGKRNKNISQAIMDELKGLKDDINNIVNIYEGIKTP
ncbi:MAG: hypothetical protein MJ252_21170 [archaeon]|nr:hypothetical protein [archaeon]